MRQPLIMVSLAIAATLAACHWPEAPPVSKAASAMSKAKAKGVTARRTTITGTVRSPRDWLVGGDLIGKRKSAIPSLTSQETVANAAVFLVDASGEAVFGPDDHALLATTDDQGQYTFPVVMTDRSLIVVATLPDDQGELQAVSSRNGGTVRLTDLDLTSTLTTRYIVNTYVKTNADPLETLDGLPGDLEAETRAIVAAALGVTEVDLSKFLTPEEVNLTMAALRSQNPDLDRQFGQIHRLLNEPPPAEVNDEPLPPAVLLAKEVPLRSIDQLIVNTDGTLLIAESAESRLWRLTSDGHLALVLDNLANGSASFSDGMIGPTPTPGPDSEFQPVETGLVFAPTLDNSGRIAIASAREFWRTALTGGGTSNPGYAPPPETGEKEHLAPLENGTGGFPYSDEWGLVRYFQRSGLGESAKVRGLYLDGTLRDVHTFSDSANAQLIGYGTTVGYNGSHIFLAGDGPNHRAIRTISTFSFEVNTLPLPPDAPVLLSPDGSVFVFDPVPPSAPASFPGDQRPVGVGRVRLYQPGSDQGAWEAFVGSAPGSKPNDTNPQASIAVYAEKIDPPLNQRIRRAALAHQRNAAYFATANQVFLLLEGHLEWVAGSDPRESYPVESPLPGL